MYLPLFLLGFLFVFSISNYSLISISIKIIYSLPFYFFFKDFRKEVESGILRRILLYALFIAGYFILTILYSKNQGFGLLKLFIMALSAVTLMPAALLVFNSTRQRNIFINSLIAFASIASLIAFLVSPFEYSTTYSFSVFRWSHVLFSRFIGLALLLNLCLVLQQKKRNLLLNLSLQIILFGLLLSGARGTIIISFFCYLTLLFFSKSVNSIKFIAIIQIVLASVLFFTIGSSSGPDRLVNMQNVILDRSKIDESMTNHIKILEISIERFREYPVLGLGLGGFNSFYKTHFPEEIIYPHNIFLEALVEQGIVGCLVLGILLYLLSRRIMRLGMKVYVMFLFALGLAMYSKDFTSNPLLLAFFAVYFIKPSDDDSRDAKLHIQNENQFQLKF